MPVQYKKMKEIYSDTGKIEQNILQRLIRTDPFGSNDYVGPYAVWIIKRYLTDGEFADVYLSKSDSNDSFLTECLRKFDFLRKRPEYKGERDIGKIKSIDGLYNEIKDYEMDIDGMYGWIKREKPDSNSVVYEDDRFLVSRIRTLEEAFYYGSKTKWCITKGTYSDNQSEIEHNSLDRFLKYGARIFIIADKLAKRLDPYSKIVMHIAPFTHTTKDYNDTCHKCGEYVPSDGFWDRWDNEPPVKQPDGSIQYRGHVGCSFMHPSELTELYNIGWPVEFIDDIIYDKCIYPSRLEIDKEIKEFYESR